MSRYIHKSHNVSVLIYHLVCPAKYRRVVFDEEVDAVLKTVCLGIEKRYEIEFLEIDTDRDHVHFLVQSVPMYSPTKIVRTVKSITAREVFRRAVKRRLWGGEFWSKGYFINTVGRHGSEEVIRRYVERQGRGGEYDRLHERADQLNLFESGEAESIRRSLLRSSSLPRRSYLLFKLQHSFDKAIGNLLMYVIKRKNGAANAGSAVDPLTK